MFLSAFNSLQIGLLGGMTKSERFRLKKKKKKSTSITLLYIAFVKISTAPPVCLTIITEETITQSTKFQRNRRYLLRQCASINLKCEKLQ